jgi:hypothetical protein
MLRLVTLIEDLAVCSFALVPADSTLLPLEWCKLCQALPQERTRLQLLLKLVPTLVVGLLVS